MYSRRQELQVSRDRSENRSERTGADAGSMFFFLRQNDTYMYVPLSKELFFKFTSYFPSTSFNKLPKMQSPLSRTFVI